VPRDAQLALVLEARLKPMPPRSEPTFLTTVLHYCPCLSSEQTEPPENVRMGKFLARCGWQAGLWDLNSDLPNTRPSLPLARALVAPHTIEMDVPTFISCDQISRNLKHYLYKSEINSS